jgi:hypothetical protein
MIGSVSWTFTNWARHSCALSTPGRDVSVFNRTRECEKVLCGTSRRAKVVAFGLEVLAGDGEGRPDNLSVLLAKLCCVVLVLDCHESLETLHATGERAERLCSVTLKRVVDANAGLVLGVGRHCEWCSIYRLEERESVLTEREKVLWFVSNTFSAYSTLNTLGEPRPQAREGLPEERGSAGAGGVPLPHA